MTLSPLDRIAALETRVARIELDRVASSTTKTKNGRSDSFPVRLTDAARDALLLAFEELTLDPSAAPCPTEIADRARQSCPAVPSSVPSFTLYAIIAERMGVRVTWSRRVRESAFVSDDPRVQHHKAKRQEPTSQESEQ